MGSLKTIIISGKDQILLQKPVRFGFIFFKVSSVKINVGELEVKSRKFLFSLKVNIAVLHLLIPFNLKNGLLPLEKHGEAFQAISDFAGNRIEINPAALLKIGELSDFQTIQPNFPTQTPSPQGGRFPVIFHKPKIVLQRLDAADLEAFKIDVLNIGWGRLEDDLILIIMLEAVRVLTISAIGGTTAGFDIGSLPRLGAERLQKGVGRKGPGPDFKVVRLDHETACAGPVAVEIFY